MKRAFFPLLLLFILVSCQKSAPEFDATGIFEATETTVYAEQPGQLLRFSVTEGEAVAAGQAVGLVDTVPLMLQMAQLHASRQVLDAQRPDVETQIAATAEQLSKARQEVARFTALVRDGAAPRKTLDDWKSQVDVLRRQHEALRSALSTQQRTLTARQHTTDAQLRQLRDQLRRCHIVAPVGGTVLEKYVEQGELVTVGKPLFKVADMNHVFLRAYVTSEQLAQIRVGQRVQVSADYGGSTKKRYPGTVAWISSKSEFTPKTILTDDERADQVYAVKVAVRTDGGVQLGMYGTVDW